MAYGVTPSIRVADLRATVDYYTDVLGFELVRDTFDHGNCSIKRGDAALMIEAPKDFYSDALNAAIRARLGSASPTSFYIEAPGIDAYYAELQARGADIIDPLSARDWGQFEFTVEAPDGTWLTFWQALS